jgi:hypothetical protein
VQRNEARSQYANGVQDAAPQSTARTFLDTRAPTGGGDVLTREPRREHLDRRGGGEVDRTKIAEVHRARQPCGEDRGGVRVDFAVPGDPAAEDGRDAEVETGQAGAQ